MGPGCYLRTDKAATFFSHQINDETVACHTESWQPEDLLEEVSQEDLKTLISLKDTKITFRELRNRRDRLKWDWKTVVLLCTIGIFSLILLLLALRYMFILVKVRKPS